MPVPKAMVKAKLAMQRDVSKPLLHRSAPQCTWWCHCHVLKSSLFTLESESGVGAWRALPALPKGSCKYSLSLSMGVFSSCRVHSFLPDANHTKDGDSLHGSLSWLSTNPDLLFLSTPQSPWMGDRWPQGLKPINWFSALAAVSRKPRIFNTIPVDINSALLYLLMHFAQQSLMQNLIHTVWHVLADVCIRSTTKVPLF